MLQLCKKRSVQWETRAYFKAWGPYIFKMRDSFCSELFLHYATTAFLLENALNRYSFKKHWKNIFSSLNPVCAWRLRQLPLATILKILMYDSVKLWMFVDVSSTTKTEEIVFEIVFMWHLCYTLQIIMNFVNFIQVQFFASPKKTYFPKLTL